MINDFIPICIQKYLIGKSIHIRDEQNLEGLTGEKFKQNLEGLTRKKAKQNLEGITGEKANKTFKVYPGRKPAKP